MHGAPWTTALAALAALLLAVPVRAQAPAGPPPDAPPPAPPVEDLVREALDRSPTLASLRSRVEAARQAVAPAGALPDPMLEAGYLSMGTPWAPERDGSMATVEFRQGLPGVGKQSARRDEAAGEVEVRGALVRQAALALQREVRTSYARLYALDREAEVLQAAAEMLSLMEATAASRYATGQAEQEALVKAQLEASRLQGRRLDLAALRAEAEAALLRLLDRPPGSAIGVVAALPAADAPPADLAGVALQNCCAIAVARAEVDAARRSLDAARLDAGPDWSVGAMAGSSLMPSAVLGLKVGIEIPAWKARKQSPRIESARAGLAAAEASLRAEEAATRGEASTLLARWRRDDAQVVLYREGIVPQSALALEAALSSYRAGRGDFSTVIEDFRMWLDGRAMLAGREADRFATWAEARYLSSASPEEVSR